MVSKEYTEIELKVLILNFLERRGRWGKNYFPFSTMVNWLSLAVKKNGKRIKKITKDLIKEDVVLTHKKGNAISLNHNKKIEIVELIDKYLNNSRP